MDYPTAASSPWGPESSNRARPPMLVVVKPLVLLLEEPAGAGHSTLARARYLTRLDAAHVQHGTARDLLVPGLKREERRDTLSVSTFTCVGAVRNVRKMELSSGW